MATFSHDSTVHNRYEKKKYIRGRQQSCGWCFVVTRYLYTLHRFYSPDICTLTFLYNKVENDYYLTFNN